MVCRIIAILFLSLIIFVGGQAWAEDSKENKSVSGEQQDIPEYFLAPEGPFKDKEAYEKALVEQNSAWMTFFGLPKKRTKILFDACHKDLKESGDDDQAFLLTRCGMLMQGYADASVVLFYSLIGGIGEDVGAVVARQKPFCITENINIIDIATIFVSYVQKTPKELDRETYGSILAALQNKYPCPRHVEMKNR